jgi:hypothetical protein
MAVACLLLKKTAQPSAKELAGLLPIVQKLLDNSILSDATALTNDIFEKYSKAETAAKGPNMLTDLLAALETKLAGPGKLV